MDSAGKVRHRLNFERRKPLISPETQRGHVPGGPPTVAVPHQHYPRKIGFREYRWNLFHEGRHILQHSIQRIFGQISIALVKPRVHPILLQPAVISKIRPEGQVAGLSHPLRQFPDVLFFLVAGQAMEHHRHRKEPLAGRFHHRRDDLLPSGIGELDDLLLQPGGGRVVLDREDGLVVPSVRPGFMNHPVGQIRQIMEMEKVGYRSRGDPGPKPIAHQRQPLPFLQHNAGEINFRLGNIPHVVHLPPMGFGQADMAERSILSRGHVGDNGVSMHLIEKLIGNRRRGNAKRGHARPLLGRKSVPQLAIDDQPGIGMIARQQSEQVILPSPVSPRISHMGHDRPVSNEKEEGQRGAAFARKTPRDFLVQLENFELNLSLDSFFAPPAKHANRRSVSPHGFQEISVLVQPFGHPLHCQPADLPSLFPIPVGHHRQRGYRLFPTDGNQGITVLLGRSLTDRLFHGGCNSERLHLFRLEQSVLLQPGGGV
ncbi:MAG: hypothetical protein Q7J69_02550 [Candidatus Omnitrophota bacterium]|nr:hypothetical protein [Candidatus Omnitrophota bacterium]